MQTTNKPRLGTLSKHQINQIAKHYANELQVPEEENQIRFHIFLIDMHVKNGGNKNDAVLNDNWKALERLGITPDYLFKKSAAKKQKKADKQAFKKEKKEIRLDKKRAKVSVKNARAENIESKAKSRETLAEQGINMTSEGAEIAKAGLSTVGNLASTLAGGGGYNAQSEPVISTMKQTGGGNVSLPNGDNDNSDNSDNSSSNSQDQDTVNVDTAKSGKSKTILFIIGGVALLVVVLFIAKRK